MTSLELFGAQLQVLFPGAEVKMMGLGPHDEQSYVCLRLDGDNTSDDRRHLHFRCARAVPHETENEKRKYRHFLRQICTPEQRAAVEDAWAAHLIASRLEGS